MSRYTGAHYKVMQHWSANTLFWQLSTDHNMDVQYQVKHKLLVCTKVFYPESQRKISNPKMFSRSQIRLNLAKGFRSLPPRPLTGR